MTVLWLMDRRRNTDHHLFKMMNQSFFVVNWTSSVRLDEWSADAFILIADRDLTDDVASDDRVQLARFFIGDLDDSRGVLVALQVTNAVLDSFMWAGAAIDLADFATKVIGGDDVTSFHEVVPLRRVNG